MSRDREEQKRYVSDKEERTVPAFLLLIHHASARGGRYEQIVNDERVTC